MDATFASGFELIGDAPSWTRGMATECAPFLEQPEHPVPHPDAGRFNEKIRRSSIAAATAAMANTATD